jgi:hypothetical protein
LLFKGRPLAVVCFRAVALAGWAWAATWADMQMPVIDQAVKAINNRRNVRIMGCRLYPVWASAGEFGLTPFFNSIFYLRQ